MASFDMTLGVPRQQASRFMDSGFVMRAGHHVKQIALSGGRMRDTIGREQRQPKAFRNRDGGAIASLFMSQIMTLQFNEYIARTKNLDKLRDLALCINGWGNALA